MDSETYFETRRRRLEWQRWSKNVRQDENGRQ